VVAGLREKAIWVFWHVVVWYAEKVLGGDAVNVSTGFEGFDHSSDVTPVRNNPRLSLSKVKVAKTITWLGLEHISDLVGPGLHIRTEPIDGLSAA